MDMKQIRNDRAVGTAEYMGETLNFKYRPAMITPMTYTKLQQADSVEELGDFFADLLVSWDLTDKGEPVEISAALIKSLPMALLRSMSSEILSAVPQREVGKDSDDS